MVYLYKLSCCSHLNDDSDDEYIDADDEKYDY